MTDVDIQFISDEVSTKYVRAVEKNGNKYQVFTLDSDFEEDIENCDKEVIVYKSNHLVEAEPCDEELIIEVLLGHKPYSVLSDAERQLFDLMNDWYLF